MDGIGGLLSLLHCLKTNSVYLPHSSTPEQLDLNDAVDLIKPAFARTRHAQTWADLGAGSGMFTRALASMLPKGSVIHAVDKKRQDIEQTFNDNAIVS